MSVQPKCIFVVYCTYNKAYKMFDPIPQKFFVIIYVLFHEHGSEIWKEDGHDAWLLPKEMMKISKRNKLFNRCKMKLQVAYMPQILRAHQVQMKVLHKAKKRGQWTPQISVAPIDQHKKFKHL